MYNTRNTVDHQSAKCVGGGGWCAVCLCELRHGVLSIGKTSEKSAPREVLCYTQHLVLASMSEAVAQQEGGCLLLHYCIYFE